MDFMDLVAVGSDALSYSSFKDLLLFYHIMYHLLSLLYDIVGNLFPNYCFALLQSSH